MKIGQIKTLKDGTIVKVIGTIRGGIINDEEADYINQYHDAIAERENTLKELNDTLMQQKNANFQQIKPYLDDRGKLIKDGLLYLNHGYSKAKGKEKKKRGGFGASDVVDLALDSVPKIVNFIKNSITPPEQTERMHQSYLNEIEQYDKDIESVADKIKTARQFDLEKAKPILLKQTDNVMKNLSKMYPKKNNKF